MFNQLPLIPVDPILTLAVECRADDNPNKVDLGAGVYKNDLGHTPIMGAIQQAQNKWLEEEDSKTYVAPAGLESFNQQIAPLLLGENHPVLKDQRCSTVQTPGGCGALNVAGHLIKKSFAAEGRQGKVWVSSPTWANHIPLLSGCGLELQEYAYYDHSNPGVDFAAMMESLSQIASGDVVLLHGCCHNPSGADLTQEQWQQVAALLQEKGAIPFVDIAYQGLGDGLDEDAWGLRYLAEHCSEMLVASSCSKNFGVYRERVGAVMVISESIETAAIAKGQLLSIARGIYSMPPNYGAALVSTVLQDAVLTQQWQEELAVMRGHMVGLRKQLVQQFQAAGAGSRFDYIQAEKGMFSFLGISAEQVKRLKSEYSIYMVNSSRINVAGLSDSNMGYFVDAVMNITQ